MRLPFLLLLILSFLVTPSLALAQDGPEGIAIVEAPEQGGGYCFAATPEKGFACAREKCAIDGIRMEDCLRVRWCFPARWSADVAIQSGDGFTAHEYLCGWDSHEALEAAAKIKCDEKRRGPLMNCAMTVIWTPDGEEMFP